MATSGNGIRTRKRGVARRISVVRELGRVGCVCVVVLLCICALCRCLCLSCVDLVLTVRTACRPRAPVKQGECVEVAGFVCVAYFV